uniref:Bm379, isoform b n=1 Tax=Brugia malayi TaxID=6279 RepID=A0A0J9XSB9_BRUMA|nr:Bm379, isoform b [Brugia malayi]
MICCLHQYSQVFHHFEALRLPHKLHKFNYSTLRERMDLI